MMLMGGRLINIMKQESIHTTTVQITWSRTQ